MISETEMILRILAASILGGLIGFERERQNQPAGLRTHIILVIGATVAMMLSINLPIMYKSITLNGDPSRIAAQVVSGIGFLGAGAIIQLGPNIKGLTTAASLWSMAIVGLAVGAGFYLLSAVTTITLLIVLFLVHKVENHFIQSYMTYHLNVKAEDTKGLIDQIKKIASSKGNNYRALSIKKNLEDKRISIDLDIRTSRREAIETLVSDISSIEGVRTFEIN